jgi:hypothetical protein
MISTLVEQAARRGANALSWVRSVSNRSRIAVKDRADARDRIQIERAKEFPSIQERRDQLVTFYTRFESLVETLCDSAQYGPESPLERRYDELRTWMQSNYPPIRRYVVAYLEYDSADAALGLESQGRGTDAFEALFVAHTLTEFLKCDDGMMISRILRTRTALNLYADHLRQLDS